MPSQCSNLSNGLPWHLKVNLDSFPWPTALYDLAYPSNTISYNSSPPAFAFSQIYKKNFGFRASFTPTSLAWNTFLQIFPSWGNILTGWLENRERSQFPLLAFSYIFLKHRNLLHTTNETGKESIYRRHVYFRFIQTWVYFVQISTKRSPSNKVLH